MTRGTVRGPYVRSVILAEVKRSRRLKHPVDFQYLRDETGLGWTRLERAVAAARKELDSAAVRIPAADGGAKPGPDPSPTKVDRLPFAPPNKSKA